MAYESLEVAECLAAFDPDTFKIVTEASTSLLVVPGIGRDPMSREATTEDVSAIAYALDNPRQMNDYERQLKEIAEQYGNHVV